MRGLLYLTLALAAIWSGYWFIGATAVERGANAALDQMRAEGWLVEVADLGTRGFPNRFDTTAIDLILEDPSNRARFSAPLFQILALSYKPNHVIAAFADSQTLEVDGQMIQIDSDGLRASLVVAPDTALTLDRTAFVATSARIASDAGWRMALTDGRFATRQSGDPLSHDVGVSAKSVMLPVALRAAVDPEAELSDTIQTLRLNATLGFDRALDRHVMAGAPPRLRRIALNQAALDWDDLNITATGTLEIGADRVPVGDITIRSSSWRRVVQMISASGLVDAGFVPVIEALFRSLAEADGTPDALVAPLTFRGGRIWFGLVPLGAAPRF